MGKINGFGIENFRVFKNKTYFNLAPITLLTGPNNSGKSSLFKAMILLTENAKMKGLFNLDFANGKHKLNTFKNSLNNKRKNCNELKFTIDIKDRKLIFSQKIRYDLCFSPSPDNENGVLNEMRVYSINDGSLIFRYLPSREYQANIKWFLNCMNQEFVDDIKEIFDLMDQSVNYSDWRQKILSEYDKTSFFNSLIEKPIQVLKVTDEIVEKAGTKILTKFQKKIISDMYISGHLPNNIRTGTYYASGIQQEFKSLISLFGKSVQDSIGEGMSMDGPFKNITKYGFITPYAEQDLFHPDFLYFIDLVRSEVLEMISVINNLDFHYIESARSTTERIYLDSAQSSSFNKLLRQMSSDPNLYQKTELLNEILKLIGIGDGFIFNRINLVGTELFLSKKKIMTNIADLGFGLSQLLPVIFGILYKAKIKTKFFPGDPDCFLIEEPESNLHPKYQSLLADIFVYIVNNFNVQLIIETHSEYLIRKLQYLTAKGKLKPNDTVIYYFHQPNNVPKGTKQIKEIKILEDGSLSDDFGPGFFDEATNIRFDLLALKKQQKN